MHIMYKNGQVFAHINQVLLIAPTAHVSIQLNAPIINSKLKRKTEIKSCQEWDLNPCPHTWTRS